MIHGRIPKETWELYCTTIYGITLGEIYFWLGNSIRHSVWFILLLGCIFWILYFKRLVGPLRWSWKLTGLIILLAFPAAKIIFEPLSAWDARSIWYFHAKILYVDNGFNSSSWIIPELSFSHVDYPKLNAILASQIASLIGYWNDYWPKLSLLVLLSVYQLGVAALPFKVGTSLLISLMGIATGGYFLWTGYMDGYLALFTLLSALFLALSLQRIQSRYYLPGLASLAIVIQLKYEGIIIAPILFGLFLCFYWMGKEKRRLSITDWVILFPFVPTAIWYFIRFHFKINNDMAERFDWSTLGDRLFSFSYWSDFGYYYLFRTDLRYGLPLFLIWVLAYTKKSRKKLSPAFFFVISAFATYSASLFVVFLCTYWDPSTHMNCSIDRLAFSLVALLIAAGTIAPIRYPLPNGPRTIR